LPVKKNLQKFTARFTTFYRPSRHSSRVARFFRNLSRNEIQIRVANLSRGRMTMKEKRRLEVVWETREITTISFRRNRSATAYCQTCETETLHLTVAEAASILNVSEFAMFRFVESSRIHSIENAAGIMLVCGASLPVLTKEKV
jgi:hypothetical protein